MTRLLTAFALLTALACGSDTPVPEYPFPESAPLEETDLAQYLGAGDEEEVEEEWDDGLSDEDMEMDGADTPPADAPADPPAESPAETPAEG